MSDNKYQVADDSSKFRNNQFQKSRNPDAGGTLAGLSPTEQEFFNSNREKSPIPGTVK